MTKILILVTNHATLGAAKEANGTYVPELTHALHHFIDAGYEYDLVSIEGGLAPIYGEDGDDEITTKLLAGDELPTKLKNTLPLSQVNAADYDAVFYPGGFGLLYDLADNEQAGKITAAIYEKGGIVGAVCHGPAGLLPITLSNGKKLLEDMVITGFTREEEVDFGTIDKIPYLLEEKLTRAAAGYNKVGPWKENVIKQDRLVTGQNPASASGVGEAMVALLS